MSTPTKSPVPVAAAAGSPGGASDRSQSPGRIRNLVERSSTFLQKRRQSFRRNRQENASGSGSPGEGRAGSPQGQGVVSRTVSKTVAALKWTPIPTTNIWGYIPLVLLILLIGFSLIGMWTILQITVLRDWWN